MKSSWVWWAAGAAGAAGVVGLVLGLKGAGVIGAEEAGYVNLNSLGFRTTQDIFDAVARVNPEKNSTLQRGYLGQPNWCNRAVALMTSELGCPVIFGEYGTRANDQIAWLSAGNDGWYQVSSQSEAQRLALEANVVLATYYNLAPGESGHMALVLPIAGAMRIAQAGKNNYNNALLGAGFGAIRPVFFAHS